MSSEQGRCFSTREFDTCQTKSCCSRVHDFRRRDMSKALLGFLICSLLKSERRIEDGVLERAQPESLNFPDLGWTERLQLAYQRTAYIVLFGCGAHCKGFHHSVVTCNATSFRSLSLARNAVGVPTHCLHCAVRLRSTLQGFTTAW
jgi:hypothetical protein